MTNDDLRNEVDELRRELERAERSALPKLLIPAGAEHSRQIAALGQDFELTKAALDARLTELIQTLPAGTAEGIMTVVNDVLSRQIGSLESLVTVVTSLHERLAAVEELIAPVLRGEAKLVAVA
jgi:hypothetical protein